VGAAVGGAALAAGRLAATRDTRPKVLGVRIPNELNPQRLGASKLAKGLDTKKLTKAPKKLTKGLDPKKLASHVDVRGLVKDVDLKGVVRHIGDFAEQVEARSDDVRTLSGQAKRLSRRVT
jgi:hypothetical protein